MLDTSFSLLERLQKEPDEANWRRLVDLYAPLIERWLRRSGLQGADVDDLLQEVLEIVVRKLPDFHHNNKTGAFRAWLRVVSVNCARGFFRARKHYPLATGDSDFLKQLDQLEDSHSDLTRAWEEEHNRFLVRRLWELIEPQFEPATRRAFRMVVIEGRKPAAAAAELGISENAVLLAKSRILRQLRCEMVGLI